MQSNTTVLSFRQCDVVDDPLTEVLRSGARQLLMQAIEMEAADFLEVMKERKLADGQYTVKHGNLRQAHLAVGSTAGAPTDSPADGTEKPATPGPQDPVFRF